MKNALNYYYDFDNIEIHQKNKDYYFKNNNYEYMFLKYDDLLDVNEIYQLSIQLNKIGFPSHEIILNKQGNILTKINENNYILLKIIVVKENININNIISFNNLPNAYIDFPKSLYRNNWYQLWINKIDYLEYQINQIGRKYFLLRESFSYYIGLAENAICLIKNIDTNKLIFSLSHKRINNKNTTYELYNPLNFIIDLRIRDVCEYFKNKFFDNENIVNEIFIYLEYNKLSKEESICFMARMLFPTYYFDVYEKIINNEIDENNINNILSKVDKYEQLIANIYLYFKNIHSIPDIEWLKKLSYIDNF